ncbi:MAG: PEP-CTERM sorting domain-containing protein [Verrucomicrobiaceae bacterium]|nr:PEP-CTERM sorting domain-containing protein [Verrucomicrobiaceae bacterium]
MFYLNNNAVNGFTGIVPASTFPNTLGDNTHGSDLSRYNAGQFGSNAAGPGGTAADIADNSGLWKALVGGRLNEDIGGTLANGYQYLGNTSGLVFTQNRDYVHAYRYTSARSGTQVLNFLAQDTDLRYDYALESRDFGGTAPASTLASIIAMTFWFCPADTDDTDAENLFGLTLRDALGQSVFSVGYTGENVVQYRLPGAGGSWISSASQVGTQGWSEMTIELNTQSNTANLSVRAYDDLTATLGASVSILTGQGLGVDADALTDLQWDLRGGTLNNGAVSYKNYFDDFSFNVAPVPEPSSIILLVLGMGMLVRRRR